MSSRKLFYKLPGDANVQGSVEANWLWREVNEGRITSHVTVSETQNGIFAPFAALTDDFFSSEVVSEAAKNSANLAKAEQLHLQATFRLHECQAHIKVYQSRSDEIFQQAKNGLEFVDAALALFPRSPNYLNTKALLLSDGMGNTAAALDLLQKAAEIAPDDIQIKQNLRTLTEQAKGCLGVVVLALATSSAGALALISSV